MISLRSSASSAVQFFLFVMLSKQKFGTVSLTLVKSKNAVRHDAFGRRNPMAKSRKQERAAEGAMTEAARAVKNTVVSAAKTTAEAAKTHVVEPVKQVLGLKKKKPPKKRHVRPARQKSAATPAPLARGSSNAARMMSAGVARGILTPANTGSAAGMTRATQPQSPASGSSGSEPTSSRTTRRLARRRTSDS